MAPPPTRQVSPSLGGHRQIVPLVATVSPLDTPLAGQAPWGGVGISLTQREVRGPSRHSPTPCTLAGPRFRLLQTLSPYLGDVSSGLKMEPQRAERGRRCFRRFSSTARISSLLLGYCVAHPTHPSGTLLSRASSQHYGYTRDSLLPGFISTPGLSSSLLPFLFFPNLILIFRKQSNPQVRLQSKQQAGHYLLPSPGQDTSTDSLNHKLFRHRSCARSVCLANGANLAPSGVLPSRYSAFCKNKSEVEGKLSHDPIITLLRPNLTGDSG